MNNRIFKSLILVFSIVALSVGCSSLAPNGAYQGDLLLYQADNAITTGYNAMHEFVKWEYENRATLERWPEIKQAANVIRANGKAWLYSAIACRDTYVASPNDTTRDQLRKALAVINTALLEANRYMIQHSQ